jgi:hypothetical protein
MASNTCSNCDKTCAGEFCDVCVFELDAPAGSLSAEMANDVAPNFATLLRWRHRVAQLEALESRIIGLVGSGGKAR